MQSVSELEDTLAAPGPADIGFFRDLEGDLLILGGAGKMGPSLARLARRAADASGRHRRIVAASRQTVAVDGVESLSCDLLDRAQLAALPDCPNIIFLAGRKFGSADNMPLTWATNTLLPALVADRFRGSRFVVLSSGNVYAMATVGATEATTPGPVGEYAQSVLGRERMFEYFSVRDHSPVSIIRLNYAVDLRYGVLLDVGQRVFEGRPVPLAMGAVNVIWQGDANSMILRSLALAETPARILNVTGPETLPVRWIAERFGGHFGVAPLFEGREAETALLNDSGLACRLLGPPRVGAEELIRRQAAWIRAGLPTLRKPTHFEVRNGAF